MSGLERNAAWSPGASFFRDGDVTMFKFVLDSSSMVGPRKATKADQEQYPDAWQRFTSPIDRDGDGEQGGSLPDPKPPRRGRPPKER